MMKIEWDRKIGTATIVGIVGALSVLVTLGVTYGSTMAKIDDAANRASEAKAAAAEVKTDGVQRDARVAIQAERLGKIETSLTFIVPAIQRIESKLDAKAN